MLDEPALDVLVLDHENAGLRPFAFGPNFTLPTIVLNSVLRI